MKKHIVLIVFAVIAFFSICITGYILLYQRNITGDLRYFCEEIQFDLQQDAEFESEYGEVVSVTLNEKKKYKKLSDTNSLIPTVVEVEGHIFYEVWFDFSREDFSYIVQYDDISEIKE